jgi:lipopolysaccharide transport system ATP-binding protein
MNSPMPFDMNELGAISVNQVSKKYKLFSSPQARLWETLYPFKKRYTEFWALKDICFEAARGETIGIIGRNGSGKSTLLQLISGVLQPSSGQLQTQGRISALLELGAGFNPEISGRENVLLNGVLMGFSNREMIRRLPMIEDFADIGKFIDQPVKTYSSGMYVRLAFASAIHVDPDILIIDEALAVGDARFQHKCYQKLDEFQRAGKTILFVTHDMHAITKLCDRAILLESGSLIKDGEPYDIVHHYHEIVFSGGLSSKIQKAPPRDLPIQSKIMEHQATELDEFLKATPINDRCVERNNYNPNEYRYGNRHCVILDYAIVSEGRWNPAAFSCGEQVDLYLKVKFNSATGTPIYGFAIKTVDGIYLNGTNTKLNKTTVTSAKAGDFVILKFSVKLNLAPGDFFLDLGVGENKAGTDTPLDIREDIIHLVVQAREWFPGLVYIETSTLEVSVTQSLESAVMDVPILDQVG